MRASSKDARAAFELLAETVGARLLSDVKDPKSGPRRGIYNPKRNGAWLLDHNGVYGGYVIAAICPSSPPREDDYEQRQSYTAETHPLWSDRCSAAEFVSRCHAARAAIAYKSRKRGGR